MMDEIAVGVVTVGALGGAVLYALWRIMKQLDAMHVTLRNIEKHTYRIPVDPNDGL